jgi:hypothetical protein
MSAFPPGSGPQLGEVQVRLVEAAQHTVNLGFGPEASTTVGPGGSGSGSHPAERVHRAKVTDRFGCGNGIQQA